MRLRAHPVAGALAVVGFLWIPILAVAVNSINQNSLMISWGGATAHWYARALHDANVRTGLVTTVEIALGSTLVSLAIAVSGALWWRRASARARAVYDATVYARIIFARPAAGPSRPRSGHPAGPPAVEVLQFEPADQTVARSIAASRFEFIHRYDTQRFLLTEPGIEVDQYEPDIFTICEDDPLSAAVRCERRYGLARGDDWRARLESVSEMRADAATFRVWTSLRAFDNEECLFARIWTFDIPRDGV